MTTFVLIHGAWHTPRVWDPVAQLLNSRGHRVIAPDLSSDRIDVSTEDEVRSVVDACTGEQSLVVVGHTLAGLVMPLLPARLDVRQLVYVNPLLPLIGSSFAQQAAAPDFDNTTEDGRQYDRDARSMWNDKQAFARLLAADCDDGTVDRLWAQLRPQARLPIREVTPLEVWPDTDQAAILYTDDADLPVGWMRDRIRERLEIDPIELPGSQLGFNADAGAFVDVLLRKNVAL